VQQIRRPRKKLVQSEIARDCLAVRVRLLSRTVSRIYDDALRPHGLTISQLNILTSIQSLRPAPSNEVASALSMEISTLSRNAALMEREGWITVAHAEHGNGRVLSLTKAGARKLVEAKPGWASAQKEAKALLGTDGVEQIMRLVDGVWARHFNPR
jgi:DNA-binding MarR family transcriptional regulator